MALAQEQVILNGKHRILRPIGEGAFARVWLAEEPEFGGRKVAIKELKREEVTEIEVRDREGCFLSEVKVAVRLDGGSIDELSEV